MYLFYYFQTWHVRGNGYLRESQNSSCWKDLEKSCRMCPPQKNAWNCVWKKPNSSADLPTFTGREENVRWATWTAIPSRVIFRSISFRQKKALNTLKITALIVSFLLCSKVFICLAELSLALTFSVHGPDFQSTRGACAHSLEILKFLGYIFKVIRICKVC